MHCQYLELAAAKIRLETRPFHWNIVGLLAVSLQSSYDNGRGLALLEISVGLTVQSIPTVALGWFALRRHRCSLYAGAFMSIAAVGFAVSL